MSKITSLQEKIVRLKKMLADKEWASRKTNEGIKILYRELEKRNKKLKRSEQKLKRLTVIDSHTGLYSHRYLDEAINLEFSRAKRHTHPLSMLMLDIDYFKSINDVYGHQFGDLVLKQFAIQIKKMLRMDDVVIRFGGEEFIIITPVTDRAGALKLARRILDDINLYDFGSKKHLVKLKLSIAVSSYPEDDIARPADFFELADKILNKTKEYGGNMVCSSLDLKKEGHEELEKHKRGDEIKFLREKIGRLTARANQSLVEEVFAFAKTIEFKDRSTGRHVERTIRYATAIAEALNLSEHEIERIGKAAALHDLGKIGISEEILRKKTKLTKKEFQEIKKHSQIGVDIIRLIHSLRDIIPSIRHHHERWDGKGYPDGLKGKEIPIGARIISVADAYQALISRRSYRPAYSEAEAMKILKKETGTKYDPKIVRIFLKILQKEK